MLFPTIFLVTGRGHASKHPSSPPCETKTHLWPPEPSGGDAPPASAQHSRSSDEEGRASQGELWTGGWGLGDGRELWDEMGLQWVSARPVPTSERAASTRLETRFSTAAALTPAVLSLRGKQLQGGTGEGTRQKVLPRVTADPGRGKDYPRPPAHQEVSQGPGQRLGNLDTWAAQQLISTDKRSPLLAVAFCSVMDTWWGQVR